MLEQSCSLRTLVKNTNSPELREVLNLVYYRELVKCLEQTNLKLIYVKFSFRI